MTNVLAVMAVVAVIIDERLDNGGGDAGCWGIHIHFGRILPGMKSTFRASMG